LTDLTGLDLADNQILDISALVDNGGLGAGDLVTIRYNYLDITPGSPNMLDIEALQGRGINVVYIPQNPILGSAVVVNFPDPGLEAAIRDAIWKPTGDIHDTDLIGLTSLDAGNRGISNLEGARSGHQSDRRYQRAIELDRP
jgi:hypothetical protein